MKCTSYFSNPSEQALLTLQVREAAELRVAREELAFLQACGGIGEEDVRRLRGWLGLAAVKAESHDVTVVVVEDSDGSDDGMMAEARMPPLVSLKSILTPLVANDASIAQLCRRVRPELERLGLPTFRRCKTVHVLASDALEVGRGARW